MSNFSTKYYNFIQNEVHKEITQEDEVTFNISYTDWSKCLAPPLPGTRLPWPSPPCGTGEESNIGANRTMDTSRACVVVEMGVALVRWWWW